ncbi:septum site-determining protein MinD [Schleiferilactobacillus perolens]|jgi:septum site-determining protein MinD|uniref:septum site-determining protein MinD n=1 Tax=Schleiferilactobacillus perolens TaxID=100468 RepID=UPI002354B1DC|nr:septum site-determining protein MinD [Schleiferilactobacillus perolens]MCI1892495.1 septum site-determining protein MinD [Schleiferilactobacillus harbinensis]MCI1913337.1 septum site-determining protein MinD [Schleiferilactobacillus harbinensis]MCI2171973.1 septum site-determining protein MinD [Schleiferilactobacillus perolens]
MPAIALVITSGKGGVGKTTSTANIGTALSIMGKRVCVVDLDLGLRNLDIMIGLGNRIIYDIVDVVQGRATLHQALVKDTRFEDRLVLLPAAQDADKNVLTPAAVRNIVEALRSEFDYILIDCPAGIEQGFRNALAGADGAVVVTTPELSAMSDADRVIGLIEAHRMPISPRLIVNRVQPAMIAAGTSLSVPAIAHRLALPLLGFIVEDNAIITADNRGEPVVFDTNSKPGACFRNITERLINPQTPLLPVPTIKKSFWAKLFNRG